MKLSSPTASHRSICLYCLCSFMCFAAAHSLPHPSCPISILQATYTNSIRNIAADMKPSRHAQYSNTHDSHEVEDRQQYTSGASAGPAVPLIYLPTTTLTTTCACRDGKGLYLIIRTHLLHRLPSHLYRHLRTTDSCSSNRH